MTKTDQPAQQGYLFRIQKYCLHDGPGIRTTLFFQGCPLNCQWCHNPESQPFANAKNQDDSENVCTYSKYSIDDLINEIEKDLIFFDQSQGGVTFSGGEPLSQPDFLLDMIEKCKKRDIHTCLDTSGYSSLKIFKKVCQNVDMILFDIKLIDNDLHTLFTGVSLEPVIENLQFLSNENIAVKIRIPLIPGITDKSRNIDGIITLLTNLRKFRDISLLPFHSTGEGKYETLGIKNRLKELKPLSKIKIEKIRQKFTNHGFHVTISR